MPHVPLLPQLPRLRPRRPERRVRSLAQQGRGGADVGDRCYGIDREGGGADGDGKYDVDVFDIGIASDGGG